MVSCAWFKAMLVEQELKLAAAKDIWKSPCLSDMLRSDNHPRETIEKLQAKKLCAETEIEKEPTYRRIGVRG